MEDFDKFDQNQNGCLDANECHLFLEHQLERKATAEEVASFMSHVDKDQDGRMNLNEYIIAVVGGEWTLSINCVICERNFPHDKIYDPM